ncbi:MAG: SagB/ThcOx family dehydrogenase, partial [Spirochaetaceae bacterium]|nr:SagB/ThcOx family dehydrogenase [Spirochaetaceae bacterium]
MEFTATERDAKRNFLRNDWGSIDFERTDQALKAPAPELEKPCAPGVRTIELTKYERWKFSATSLVDAILNRQSRRKYRAEQISLDELSFLLYATQGVRRSSAKFSLRTVPSGGARHPFETYIFVERVEGVPRGLYRYLPLEHRLCEVVAYREGLETELDAATLGQFWEAAVYFI